MLYFCNGGAGRWVERFPGLIGSKWSRWAGVITIATNITLTGLRVLAGVLSGSAALMADAANSGTDILATLVVMGGTRIAALPPDPEHPYGHEKAEPVAPNWSEFW